MAQSNVEDTVRKLFKGLFRSPPAEGRELSVVQLLEQNRGCGAIGIDRSLSEQEIETFAEAGFRWDPKKHLLINDTYWRERSEREQVSFLGDGECE